MSDFRAQMAAVRAKAAARLHSTFLTAATEVHRSMQTGSEITSAPGQPVDTGNLRASIQLTFPSATTAMIGTNVEYAKPIEEGIGPNGALNLRSKVGGFHSRKLTIAGWRRIVEFARDRAVEAIP